MQLIPVLLCLDQNIYLEKNSEQQDYIPVGCVPPASRPYLQHAVPRGGVPGPGGCAWSWGVPCPRGCTWSWGGVPGPGGYLVLGGTWSWGVYLAQGVYLVQGGCTWSWGCTWSLGGVPGPGGCTWSGTPPVNRIIHTCKNINLAPTSLRAVIRASYSKSKWSPKHPTGFTQ